MWQLLKSIYHWLKCRAVVQHGTTAEILSNACANATVGELDISGCVSECEGWSEVPGT